MDPVGSQQFAYVPGAGNGEAGAHAPARFATRTEPERGRTEEPVWAYCRELCGPETCDAAVAAIMSALTAGPATITEDELLLITRATAARFTAPATDAYSCAETPVRLAAWAGDELDPDERHELREHLAACLPCHAIKVRMDRAERGFATLSARAAAVDRGARADSASLTGADGDFRTELASGRAKAAVRAYCRELCGPIGSGRAVVESVAAAGIEADSATVAGDELLRLTRVAAAKHALIDADEQLNTSAPRDAECTMTPARLAAAANGELEPVARLELERHLEQCLVCQASRIKLNRAERAFATIVSAAGAGTPAPGAASASHPRIRARRLTVLGALGLAAAAAVLAAGGAFSTTSAPPALPTAAHPAPASPAPARATGAAATALKRHAPANVKAKVTPARHRAPAQRHRAARAHRAAPPKHTAAPAAKPAPASAPAHAPKPTRAPASAPSASKPASSPASSPSTPSVTPLGTNLPAQSAPTQGIGSGGG